MFYSYEEFVVDAKKMAAQIKSEFSPDVILAVARGGLTLGHALAVALDNRNLFTLNSIHYDDTRKLDTIEVFNIPDLGKFKKVLLVDDMVDSGESMIEVKRRLLEAYPELQIKLATVFYKQKALILPDYKVKEASEWVEFFWDIHI